MWPALRTCLGFLATTSAGAEAPAAAHQIRWVSRIVGTAAFIIGFSLLMTWVVKHDNVVGERQFANQTALHLRRLPLRLYLHRHLYRMFLHDAAGFGTAYRVVCCRRATFRTQTRLLPLASRTFAEQFHLRARHSALRDAQWPIRRQAVLVQPLEHR